MRISNSTLLRNYDRNLKRVGTQKFASENRIYTGRQYTRASQSPIKAAKALTVRKQLWHTEQYKENLDVADKFYTEAETALLQISESLAEVRETLIYACNSTKEGIDLDILAQQVATKAEEMTTVFNTNSAERTIFGGESNNPEPFRIEYDESGMPTTVTYHGVPVNAYQKYTDYPYSNGIYIDIGNNLVINDAQEIDPQTGLKISFVGTDVTGCGFDTANGKISDIHAKQLDPDGENIVRINAKNKTVEVKFNGSEIEDVRKAINTSFKAAGFADADIPALSDKWELSMADGSKVYVQKDVQIRLDKLTAGEGYSFDIYAGGVKKTVSFTAGAAPADNVTAIQNELNNVFNREKAVPKIDADGVITYTFKSIKGDDVEGSVYLAQNKKGKDITYTNNDTYSKNYIQLTLDAAAALRKGDIDYANACIDRIVSASENLLVEIADLGNTEEYIDFSQNRFDVRTLNLKDRQKTLEATDLESEITLMKTYEAIYNACLNMASSIVPQSIFNYIS